MTQIADFIIMSKQGKYFTSLSKNGKIKDIIQVIFKMKTGIETVRYYGKLEKNKKI